MPAIKNNSKCCVTVSDLDKTWMEADNPFGGDIITITERDFRGSAHLQSLLIDGVFERIEAVDAGSILSSRRKDRNTLEADSNVILENTEDKEFIHYNCFGVKADGSPCTQKVLIIEDGTEPPLCHFHKKQTDRCRWDAGLKKWLPTGAADSKLDAKELTVQEAKDAGMSVDSMTIPGYQQELKDTGSLNPNDYNSEEARLDRQRKAGLV